MDGGSVVLFTEDMCDILNLNRDPFVSDFKAHSFVLKKEQGILSIELWTLSTPLCVWKSETWVSRSV